MKLFEKNVKAEEIESEEIEEVEAVQTNEKHSILKPLGKLLKVAGVIALGAGAGYIIGNKKKGNSSDTEEDRFDDDEIEIKSEDTTE